jgi:hypothetical protein
MDLTFSEIDNNDTGYPNESRANINYDKYWDSNPQQETETPAKKKVSFDDIMRNMNLVVSKTGVLQSIRPQPQRSQHQPQRQTQYNSQQSHQQPQYQPQHHSQHQPQHQPQHRPQQQPQPNKAPQLESPLDPSIKHSYIFNKYFKDYQSAAPQEPEIRVPKTREEYFRMVTEERIRQMEERKRISQIKSTKLLFTTNSGPQGTVQASKNTLGKLRFG